MYKVYCLASKVIENFHYYGFTNDIQNRLKAHNSGKVKTTKSKRPLVLIGYKSFDDKKEALIYEKK